MPRGGKRDGAGRPKLNVKRVNFTLPPEHIAWLKSTGNASKAIRELINEKIRQEAR
jgi:hypothetical protein